MDTFAYKGISDGKYVEGNIEAINSDEASHKLKEQKIIITNLTRAVKGKKKDEKKGEKKKKRLFFIWQKESKSRRCSDFFQAICNNGQSWITNPSSSYDVKRSVRKPCYERGSRGY